MRGDYILNARRHSVSKILTKPFQILNARRPNSKCEEQCTNAGKHICVQLRTELHWLHKSHRRTEIRDCRKTHHVVKTAILLVRPKALRAETASQSH